ncbi:Uncharacterised protein [Sphingobacterium daejeonense]|nr:Uncharacterised protein [Sphingobacterium daejeonense]
MTLVVKDAFELEYLNGLFPSIINKTFLLTIGKFTMMTMMTMVTKINFHFILY